MTKLLDKFGLIIEHSKTEVFHFNRSHGPFIPPPLDLSFIEGFVLTPKNSWKYLGFIFDRKLSFYQHIDFYSMSYASLPIWKLHSYSNIISKLYNPAFHSSHLSCNISYSSVATIWVFHLPWQRYSYLTWFSMMELLLSVSQH